MHHEYRYTSAAATQHAALGEVLLSLLPAMFTGRRTPHVHAQYVTPAGPLLLGTPLSVVLVWYGWRMVEAFDKASYTRAPVNLSDAVQHSGYELPVTLWYWLPGLLCRSAKHDFHHSHNVGCYGSYFNVRARVLDHV